MSIRIGHPKLKALHTLWQSRRAADRLPARGDFDVTELVPWMGNLMLLDVLDDGADFRYRLHGIHLVELVGEDLTGRRLGKLKRLAERLLPEYREAWRLEDAFYLEKQVVVGKDRVKLAKLILPLAADGCAGDMLLAGVYKDDRVPAVQRPVKAGRRFSMKARRPST